MSDTIRIKATPDGSDTYIKVKLDQEFDFIEILSLKLTQEEVYRKFCSDYGVIVGRVNINQKFGVPNVKVSVFIPLDDVDNSDSVIKNIYPYEIVSDTDSNGVRYNLLQKDADPTNDCFSPIGTFPSKREVLDNPVLTYVYNKYYKFTTTTNHAGDYMLFGVPLGTYTVHIDADISDIGILSSRPYDLISQGTPSKLFESPTKFKSGKNLNTLVQIKTINAGVNIQPFWGDSENCEIGITRLDFDLNHTIIPSAIFMGSIFGDQDKHSINKHCRPRKDIGNLCEQVSGAGSVKMIRKTLYNTIEEFNVDGGDLIDEDGTWAFQVPMNLDYIYTNENGDLVSSQDPNIGIPTRASVRFNIGMYETGGEGRLRTRARFLVPNNPKSSGEIDYEFGDLTKDSSFSDMYWNKIYSVSNFISRFQSNNISNSRNFTGIKDIDTCGGLKTPFPYNRVDTSLNPIFFVICLIMKYVGFIVWFFNSVIIALLNFIIYGWNTVLGAICKVNWTLSKLFHINDPDDCEAMEAGCSGTPIPSVDGNNCDCDCNSLIPYIPCIAIKCPTTGGDYYAPGCQSNSDGFNTSIENGTDIKFCPDCPDSIGDNSLLKGLDDCISFELATQLDMYKFDFYNDWVNGTLFSFLVKYKKRNNDQVKFCEYECINGDFTPDNSVDGDNDSVGDNRCSDNFLFDIFTNAPIINSDQNWQNGNKNSGIIKDGLIKSLNGELFYASTTHDNKYKLFATDLINLGSVFNCDWQGIPKIQQYLPPTTYKIPPQSKVENNNNIITESGIVLVGDSSDTNSSLFFSINCLGLNVNHRNSLNIRHICEIGVDTDQLIDETLTTPSIPVDYIIGVDEIDKGKDKYVRDVLFGLNNTNTPSFSSTQIYTTNFNIYNDSVYDFTSPNHNGVDYLKFRDFSIDSNSVGASSFGQTEHSYYFYFGLSPGKTALDKMNNTFFATCKTKI